jgi:hypothetical protein
VVKKISNIEGTVMGENILNHATNTTIASNISYMDQKYLEIHTGMDKNILPLAKECINILPLAHV